VAAALTYKKNIIETFLYLHCTQSQCVNNDLRPLPLCLLPNSVINAAVAVNDWSPVRRNSPSTPINAEHNVC